MPGQRARRCGNALVDIALFGTQDLQQIFASKHVCGLNRGGCAESGIGASSDERADDVVVRLEDGACDDGLATVVEPVRIGAAHEEGVGEGCVACIGREHEQRIS